jgi:hypothetical protein
MGRSPRRRTLPIKRPASSAPSRPARPRGFMPCSPSGRTCPEARSWSRPSRGDRPAARGDAGARRGAGAAAYRSPACPTGRAPLADHSRRRADRRHARGDRAAGAGARRSRPAGGDARHSPCRAWPGHGASPPRPRLPINRSGSSAPTPIRETSSSARTAARCSSIWRRRSTARRPSTSPIAACRPRPPGTSTSNATLSRDEVIAFYRHYLSRIDPRLAAQLRPLLAPSRRLTWLRTMMWCARWRVAAATSPDWSQDRVDPVLLAHIRRRVAAFFTPKMVAAVRAEWLSEAPSRSRNA